MRYTCSLVLLFYVLLVSILGTGEKALAANVYVVPDTSVANVTFIAVEGDFTSGDEQQFAQIAIQHPNAVVMFNSPGGNLAAGIEIGKAIRLKGYWTYVPAGLTCASVCALAWLGGVQRFMEPTSKIGFHAAYNSDNGQTSGSANAIVGSYLTQLGMSEQSIFYVTDAAPEGMTWMTYEDATKMGIAVNLTNPPPQAKPEQPPNTPAAGSPDIISLPGSDIFGHDLPGMPLKNVMMADCQKACESDSRCLAFTFNRKHSVCFLKSAGERVFLNSNADSGYKAALKPVLRNSSINILEATDLQGGDYNQLDGVGFGVCSDTCEEDSRCRAFTYRAKSKTCWLKSEVPPASTSKRVISGVKR